jgi:hypothetical protein
MSPNPSPGSPHPLPSALDPSHLKARLDHLFRLSLQRQEINPLMHLVWRYRSDVTTQR